MNKGIASVFCSLSLLMLTVAPAAADEKVEQPKDKTVTYYFSQSDAEPEDGRLPSTMYYKSTTGAAIPVQSCSSRFVTVPDGKGGSKDVRYTRMYTGDPENDDAPVRAKEGVVWQGLESQAEHHICSYSPKR